GAGGGARPRGAPRAGASRCARHAPGRPAPRAGAPGRRRAAVRAGRLRPRLHRDRRAPARHACARLPLPTAERSTLVTELSTELDAIGIELRRAYAGRLRRRRLVRMTASTGALLALLAATAAAAAGDLQLDPAKWTIVGGGSVDNGQAEYVHAKRVDGGGTSTFMVEHDGGMDRYQAFLLHEKVKAAADGTSPVPITTEPGALCTREQ